MLKSQLVIVMMPNILQCNVKMKTKINDATFVGTGNYLVKHVVAVSQSFGGAYKETKSKLRPKFGKICTLLALSFDDFFPFLALLRFFTA